MYLLYADASGTPDMTDHSTEYVLVGLALPESSWDEFAGAINALKERYGLLHTNGELHAKDFCVTIAEQRKIENFEALSWEERRHEVQAMRGALRGQLTGKKKAQKLTYHRNTEPFIHLSRRERSKLLIDVLDLVGNFRKLRLFGECIRKSDGKADIVAQAFEQLVSRFDSFLDRINARAGREYGRTQAGQSRTFGRPSVRS
ncbi:MAG TPA: DUF3800 domain-containing protein [Polyangiaceae bacterium]|nr:DUF3800 domain-containing protein [Polyangiaceae bacterium]